MAWDRERTASSKATGNRAWAAFRLTILQRDAYQCQIRGPHCTGHANQVDHTLNVASGGHNLDPQNAQAACAQCNAHKAQQESAHARHRNRSAAHHPGTRERPPGEI